MKTHSIQLNSQPARWQEYSDSGPPVHFFHANGFPLGAYKPLLGRLAEQYRVCGVELRATWPEIGQPPPALRWDVYGDDLIAFLDAQFSEPVIGIGHSIGATATVYAAQKRPDLFKALVLIEPATVSPGIAFLLRLIPGFMMRRSEPTKSTLNKPDRWPSRDAFLESCRGSRQFKRFDEEALEALAAHAVRDNGAGDVELVFSKAWEAHNYSCPPAIISKLQSLRVPCIGLRGKPSMFFTDSMWDQWQRMCPDTRFEELPQYGHLLPLEAPAECASIVHKTLADLE